MQAMVYTKYGPPEVFQLKEVPDPIPKDNQILIKIAATSVSSGDWKLRKAEPFIIRLFFGMIRPRKTILGYVLVGKVIAMGKKVSLFKQGDEVWGTTGMSMGAYAHYKCLPEKAVVTKKPSNMTHEQAAAIPFGGNTALYYLRKANIKSAHKVLIYGASGAVGTAAVQLAKYFGANVTAVCSTTNIAMVSSLGADKVIDYTKEDFSKTAERYDIIFDTVGKTNFNGCINLLNKNGYLLLTAPRFLDMLKGIWVSLGNDKKVVSGVMNETADDLLFLKNLIEQNKMKAVIDRCYPLEQLADAHRYVEQGHKKGNVVITLKQTHEIKP